MCKHSSRYTRIHKYVLCMLMKTHPFHVLDQQMGLVCMCAFERIYPQNSSHRLPFRIAKKQNSKVIYKLWPPHLSTCTHGCRVGIGERACNQEAKQGKHNLNNINLCLMCRKIYSHHILTADYIRGILVHTRCESLTLFSDFLGFVEFHFLIFINEHGVRQTERKWR